jgi:hypothetical protein
MATFHIDCEFDHDVLARPLFVFDFAVPATPSQRVVAERVTISARMRRLSPMVAAAAGTETPVPLQTPGAGIVLAPAEASAPRGP